MSIGSYRIGKQVRLQVHEASVRMLAVSPERLLPAYTKHGSRGRLIIFEPRHVISNDVIF